MIIRTNPIYFIAEIGINHNGSLELALRLIEVAARAGCDAVKFQKRDPYVCVPQNMREILRETPWGDMTYFAYKQKIEFGREEYNEIDRYCSQLGIDWSASAWDLNSLDFLNEYNLKFNKVPSALTTNVEFVKAVASQKKLTYLSVGMCTYDDIDLAVSIFAKANCPLVLLHTISTYPADEADLNLRMIETLTKRYNLPVGYSGHETSVAPSIVAASLGAVAIERHITLDRSMWGTDQAASLEPAGLNYLLGTLRKIDLVLGDGIKKSVTGERDVARKLRYWET